MDTKRLVLLAVFTTIALTIYVIEANLPPLLPIPGIKLGLANIVTLFVIKRMSAKDAALVLLLRVILATILTGQAVSFIYSLFGGALCLVAMWAVNFFLQGKAIFITSIFGGIFHNTGQILAALFVLRMSGILAYLPYLIISGFVTGLFTGLMCFFMDKYIPKNLTSIYESR